MFKIETKQIKEEIIKQEYVSHLKFPGYAGGTLFLTPKRVFFKSKDSDFKNYHLDFPLGANLICKSFNLLGFIKNAIRLQVGSKPEVFFLENRDEWVKAVQSQILAQKK